jgi:hypothetical protein
MEQIMKSLVLCSLLLSLYGSLALAEGEVKCSSKALECQLNILDRSHAPISGHPRDEDKKFFSNRSSGNTSEPGQLLSNCELSMDLRDGKGRSFRVTMKDQSYTVNILVTEVAIGGILSNLENLAAVPDQTFYFDYVAGDNRERLSCILK